MNSLRSFTTLILCELSLARYSVRASILVCFRSDVIIESNANSSPFIISLAFSIITGLSPNSSKSSIKSSVATIPFLSYVL